jgi:glutathione S-transferase
MAKPQLYQLSISPSCQRVFATLTIKGVEYDPIDIDISKKECPADFVKISRFGKVPVLVHDGQVILESANIIQYIDEVWPTPALMLPRDPKKRAYARQWIQYSDRELFDRDAQFTHVERDLERKQKACSDLFEVLALMDRELAGKDKWFLGDDLSLVDCMMAPTMNLLPVWAKLTDNPKFDSYKNVRSYTDRLRKHPVFAEKVFGVPINIYEGFFKAVLVDGMTFPM